MQLYRYWTRKSFNLKTDCGREAIQLFGYSNESPQAAERMADTLFRELERSIAAYGHGGSGRPWDYSDGRPIREEILRELGPRDIVSRNRYGAEVLNSETHAFIDVDFLKPPRPSWLATLFGRARPDPLPPAEFTLKKVVDAASDATEGLFPIRLYLTKNGYRLVVQNVDIAPASDACDRLMRRFHADSLYACLCASQQCFRARLTPKPHRIHVKGRKFVWPEPGTPEQLADKESWLAEYAEKSKGHAVCQYLDTLNGPRADDAVLDFHDAATGAFSGNPLA